MKPEPSLFISDGRSVGEDERSRGRALPHVLVVDDSPSNRETLAEILEELPAKVYTAAEMGAALKIMSQTYIDTVVSDHEMPLASGLDLLKLVRRVSPNTDFVLVTGRASVRDAVTAIKEGASDYLTKPIRYQELHSVVRRCLERRFQARWAGVIHHPYRQEPGFSSIVTCSPRMHEVLSLVKGVADTEVTVLISGESGTGKELIARAVVENSRRKGKPFYTVNCAALTESLVESELFGHVKGAFTGAVHDRMGILGEADGGSVLLDEVGELPLPTQAKLLRFLETGEIQRVGAPSTRRVDVRIVASTNRDLQEEIRWGKFREDLFFRLNVVSVDVPPLRERPEDIPLLADYFINEMNKRYRCRVEGLSRNAREVLTAYRWPGNVRELRNWIERMVIVKREGVLEVDDLHGGDRRIFEATSSIHFSWPDWSLDQLTREYIRHVLRETRGNRTLAADRLGISRVTLWRKLKEMSLG